jgi:hypothetical protein
MKDEGRGQSKPRMKAEGRRMKWGQNLRHPRNLRFQLSSVPSAFSAVHQKWPRHRRVFACAATVVSCRLQPIERAGSSGHGSNNMPPVAKTVVEWVDEQTMRALSIRQPFAELILRGMKTIEYRSRPTRIIGERFLIYASKKKWPVAESKDEGGRMKDEGERRPLTSDNLTSGSEAPPWMIELANALRLFPRELPTGVIVGSAVIEKVVEVSSGQSAYPTRRGEWPVASPSGGSGTVLATGNSQLATLYEWHLADVQRAARFRKPRLHPQPVWFKPF